MKGDVTYVQLTGPCSTATLGLYAGIPPQELQQLVRVALRHREGVCAGFLVASDDKNSRGGRKKRYCHSLQRLVPLSVACKAPELLVGRVSALIASSGPIERCKQLENSGFEASNDRQRLQRLLQALESEQNLSRFEAALLSNLCEQQSAHILPLMAGNTSVDQKKSFLLRLLRPDKGLQTPTKIRKNDQEEDLLPAALIAQTIAAIGRKVCSPQVQMQVLALSRGNWQMKTTNEMGGTMKLLNIVGKLLDKHAVPEEQILHLLELVLNHNPVLWSAFHSYNTNKGSLSDLETTAKRLAAIKQLSQAPKATTDSQNPLNVMQRQTTSISVVNSLFRQQMLTSLELNILLALVAQNDAQVQQLIHDFQSSEYGDVGTLRDSLVGIVEELTIEVGDEEKAAAAFAHGLDDAVRREANESLEDQDSDDKDMLGWQRHLTFLLEQWQAREELTCAAARTLQTMVIQRHNLLESAYEVFATDADATELLDTLQRVAKLQHQIEQSRTGSNAFNGATETDVSLESVVRQMQQRGMIQAEDVTGLLGLFHGGNEALRAANEAFQADNDVHELEETLMLVVKHARFGSDIEDNKAINEVEKGSHLLAEVGRSGRLSLWQIQLLITLLKGSDPRLLAAMDVYDEDKNLEEFIETLAILAHLAARENHFHALMHDWITSFVQNEKLTCNEAERLIQLAKVRDHRLVAAFVLFLSDNNQDTFVGSLRQIASPETHEEWTDGHAILALLKEFEEQDIVSCEEREQVEALVCSGESRMLAAMDVLAETQDAEDFADTVRRILAKLKEEQDVDNEIAKPFKEVAASCLEGVEGVERTALAQGSDKEGEGEAKDTVEELAACSVIVECGSLEDKEDKVVGNDDQVTDVEVIMVGDQEQDVTAEDLDLDEKTEEIAS